MSNITLVNYTQKSFVTSFNGVNPLKLFCVKFTHSFFVGNCDIFVKRKISVINKTKQDEILSKPKVYDQENLRGIL